MAVHEIVAGGHLVASVAVKSTACQYFAAVGEVKRLVGSVFFASLGYDHAHYCYVEC